MSKIHIALSRCRLFDEYQTEYNELDEISFWSGEATNSFLVGMESHHDNGAEDRIYRYFYQNSENWVLSQCSWKTLNSFDHGVDYVLQTDQVIAGNRWNHGSHVSECIHIYVIS